MNPKYLNPDASEGGHRSDLSGQARNGRRSALIIYLLLAVLALFLSGCRAAGCGCPMY